VPIWLRGRTFGGTIGYVDANQVATLRQLLAPTGWLDRTRAFAFGLRKATRMPGGLLLVGTPDHEPWHLAAHLDEESRLSGIHELVPTLVRWRIPEAAPPHLRTGLDRLEAARRGETLFVVSPAIAPVPLLERADHARRAGATIFALDGGDPELDALAHEAMTIRPDAGGPGAPVSFGVAEHLISAACGDLDAVDGREFGVASGRGSGTAEPAAGGRGGQPGGSGRGGQPGGIGYQRYRPGVRGWRDRVARLLDAVSGPAS
jgi:hypothetical protein